MNKTDWYTIALMMVGVIFLVLVSVRVIEFIGDVIWAFDQVFGG